VQQSFLSINSKRLSSHLPIFHPCVFPYSWMIFSCLSHVKNIFFTFATELANLKFWNWCNNYSRNPPHSKVEWYFSTILIQILHSSKFWRIIGIIYLAISFFIIFFWFHLLHSGTNLDDQSNFKMAAPLQYIFAVTVLVASAIAVTMESHPHVQHRQMSGLQQAASGWGKWLAL
jgi:hypothetical protein